MIEREPLFIPRSKGGATEWKNVVLADKRINNIRGNRSLKEAGLTLKIQRIRLTNHTVDQVDRL
jgi:5-methylcytosine-specific restriction endonuclease McrA